MKYTGQYWIMIAPFMKRLLAKKYGRKAAREYIKKAKPIYRQMLSQAEDIGAKNPMAHNVYMSFVFMAIWKAAALPTRSVSNGRAICPRRVASSPFGRDIRRPSGGGVSIDGAITPDDMRGMTKGSLLYGKKKLPRFAMGVSIVCMYVSHLLPEKWSC
ncbi:MAG: hypothetical protein LIP11_09245 [Clostridiales bacterium]|nr:hypothetical protein [Clostridiales bacterium]